MLGKSQSENLISEFAFEYTEKLFYFCLKKTGNQVEAEDLASDIMLNVIHGLQRGTEPLHFSAWVWKIARNRYSVWAERKHQRNKSISETDISELEVMSESSMEGSYLQSETLRLLRRELAFVSKDYREILVAFYIEDRKVKDIALSLGIPEGTIKTKLFRARNKLKEGMNMAREFGIRSYKPEEVKFASSGSQPSGLPHSAVQRQIPQNILLQASNNPSTIEELSIELGIATPYMEEEVKLLTDYTLLWKMDDNKYITNFFIADKECQREIYKALRLSSKERTDLIDALVSDSFSLIKSLKLVRNNMTDEELKWFLVIHCEDYIIEKLNGYDIVSPVTRNDGGDWGFIGFEENDITERIVSGLCGSGNDDIAMFLTYNISDYFLWDRAGILEYRQTLLLADIIKNERKIDTLTDSEKLIWKEIDGRFAHVSEKGNIIPDILVLEKETKDSLYKYLTQHTLYPQLIKKYQEAFDDVVAFLKSKSDPVLHKQLNYCASMFIYHVRMMLIHDEVEAKKLIVPENPEKSTIAMWLEIK